MTSVIAPPPPPVGQPPAGHPVVRFTASLAGALDRLAEVPMWSMTPEEEREASGGAAQAADPVGGAEAAAAGAGRPRRGRHGLRGDVDAGVAGARHEDHHRGAHRDLHLAKKLDETFHATRAALAAGLIDVEKAAIVTGAVEALTGEYDDLPRRHRGEGRGAHGRPGQGVRRPHPEAARQTAVRGGLPRGRRRRRRQEAGEGGGQGPGVRALHGPRQRRRHQPGHVQAAHPARRPAEEGPGGNHLTAPDRRRPARPGDREEAAALHPARARV